MTMDDIERMAKACEAAWEEKASLKMSMVASRADLAAEYETASALAQAAAFIRAHAWRPIETAPRDGTAVLAFDSQFIDYGSGRICVAWFEGASWQGFPWKAQGAHPTHWLPLPALPKSK
jgi:hypothetical protein